MRDTDGRILIPNVFDDVRPLTETERRALAAAPNVDARMRSELGLARSEGGGESLLQTLMPRSRLALTDVGSLCRRGGPRGRPPLPDVPRGRDGNSLCHAAIRTNVPGPSP